jgi:hypothetical protein
MTMALHPGLRTPQSGTCLRPVRSSTLPKVNAAIAKGYAK